MRTLIIICAIGILLQSCDRHRIQLTEIDTQNIIQSAKEVVKKVFDYSNNMDFQSGLSHYSQNSNSYFIIDGKMHSLADLKQAYDEVGPAVEELHNTIQSWNVQVLSANVVTFTLPVALKLKLKGIPEFSGQLVWTATLQKQDGQWMIVQSHESWLNCAEVAAAMSLTNDA